MDWVEIRVHTTAEAEEAVSHLLLEAGADGTAVLDAAVLTKEWETPFGEWVELSKEDYPDEGVWISGYFSEKDFHPSIKEKLEKAVAELAVHGIDPGPAKITTRRVSEDSWAEAWKVYWKPIHVSSRLTVKPHWETYEPRSEEETVIELDPGMAFGTGSHPTTLLSLMLLEKHLRPGERVIDVGCGSGILSIAAARLGAEDVLALDLDPLAVESTRQNVRLNGLGDRIRVRRENLLQGVEEKADLVISNILAEIILRFTRDLSRVVKPGGCFISSGIIHQKEEDVVSAIREAGFQIVERMCEGDWVALAARS
ncbi:[LSU ribosomal protein L11P]-lysine N-methyltransferase [Melghirimyces profundicolus]|uniref:Ribosomal protein L11 methyltransferase n=1 Tax=Melghirimyces profundicolus TaxID=1242148 RepID=A0A2T6C937_9BACL|nr:50S ribosomal protein L11 methyltransferase [Melghirimyces profundicolus]PTX64848.1 [LSU ribosomal protein L11P]-lysine N-methyltransferase [Melghirimyces profundicolus]